MAFYQYTPINSQALQIRVLHILPKSHADLTTSDRLPNQLDTVSCTLHVVSLREAPDYHALSYCWGDPDLPRAQILLDETEVDVTISLEQALKTFRHATKPMVLWADAICINQNDPEEKAEQIKLMRDIYSCASIVDVFLGEGTPRTDDAMDAALTIGQAAYDAGIFSVTVDSMRDCEFYVREGQEGYGFNRPKIDDPLANVKRSLYQLAIDIGLDFPFIGWHEIGSRDYWNRLWIMQEFCLGKELMITCGQKTIPFHHWFESAWIFFAMQSSMIIHTYGLQRTAHDPIVSPILQEIARCLSTAPISLNRLLGTRKHHRKTGGSPLVKLLERGCIQASNDLVRKARYPRDRIYGLLGMASDAQSLNIQPIYTNIDSDEETVQIFTSVSRKLLVQNNGDLLAWNQQPKTLEGLPSWAPDFTNTLLEPSCETKKAALFSASGQSELSIVPASEDKDPKIIGLRGVRVDTVMAIGSLFTVDNRQGIISRTTDEYLAIHANTMRYFDEITHFCEQAQTLNAKDAASPLPQDGMKWFGANWRIPCADQTDSFTFRTRASHTSLMGYNDLRRSIELYSDNARSITDNHLSEEEFDANTEEHIRCVQTAAYASYKNAMSYQQNRRPSISEQGYVGLVPGHSLPGDVIVIIFGMVQPFVIRSVGEDRWELIGEAYVHGIMDGEIMKDNTQTEDFLLT
ncbi:putative heterokaryon incompatibility protein [Botrytis fragariae]|uniref:Putative heterokaryon incompatibility protein n=1 Tax=Botrytis fragariae TaxID=1964551 RepID=A0A8H6B3V0_9HELO|nr:putative heterokaryon incompatibility protein [Botrytis fragariae]KAF5878889.1 putative heterokaryon incompatibility protein [Botrytis fragariae]